MPSRQIMRGQVMASAISPEKLTYEATVDIIGLERLAQKAGQNKSGKSKIGPVVVRILKREVCK